MKRSIGSAGARRRLGFVLLAAVLTLPQAVQAQWQIAAPDGKSSFKLGFLLQGRADFEQSRDAAASPDHWTAQNIYLRRLRLLFGADLDGGMSVFADTDCPNYGKVTAGVKDYPDLYLQDFVVSWKVSNGLRLDTGLILTPGSYNHLQSAATLFAMDYGPYTFVESTPLKAKIGRDVGIQGRGVIASGHVEYRLGTFQGIRQGHATSAFRTAGRLSWSPYPMESALFYSGTSFGKEPAFTIGVAADVQGEFRSYHGDLHLDEPLGPGATFTLQLGGSKYDGGRLLPTLALQRDYLAEAGVSLFGNRIAPFTQLARQDLEGTSADETVVQTGLAWWVNAHRATVKFAWARASSDALGDRDQLLAQYQAFGF